MNLSSKSMLTITGLLLRRISGIIDRIELSNHLSEPENKTAHSQEGRISPRKRKMRSHKEIMTLIRKLVMNLQPQNLSTNKKGQK